MSSLADLTLSWARDSYRSARDVVEILHHAMQMAYGNALLLRPSGEGVGE